MAPLQKSKSTSQADQLQIQHFTHPHMLHKIYMTSEFNCDGCNTGGHGLRYQCSACDFDLHEKCATSPYHITSHLHPHHQLSLVNRPGDPHFCNVCRGFTNGLSYTCECQTCEFDLHVLCVEIPVATGVPSTLGPVQNAGGVSWGQPAAMVAVGTSQPIMINQNQHQHLQQQHHQHQHQQQLQQQQQQQQQRQQQQQHQPPKQGVPMTASAGYNAVNQSQPMMINQQQKQGIPTEYGGYNGANNSQPVMVNHHQQQQQQVINAAPFGGYNGENNNNQPMMVNQQPQQQQHYQRVNSSPLVMVNQQPQLQQFGCYPGVNTNQMMINQQRQQQLQQGMPMMVYNGGYNGVNNNQNMMMNGQQQQQPGSSNNYGKMGKFAANILTTSLIGIPLFNTRR